MNSPRDRSLTAAVSCLVALGLFGSAAVIYLKSSVSASVFDVVALIPYSGAIAGVTPLIDRRPARSVVVGAGLVIVFGAVSLLIAELNGAVTDQYFLFIKQGAMFAAALCLGILVTGALAIVRRN